MVATVLAILGALPQVVELVITLVKFIKVGGGSPSALLPVITGAITKLNESKTPEDRGAAAKAIADAIASFPSK